MKYYLLNSIQRIKKYSNLLDAKSTFFNKNLVVFNGSDEKQQFIFRPNNELLISQKGIVSKAKWELLDPGTILIEIGELSYLFNIAIQDDQFLILQLDGNKDFFILYDDKELQEYKISSEQDIDRILLNKYIYPYIKLDKLDVDEKTLKEECLNAKRIQNKQTYQFLVFTALIIMILSIMHYYTQ